MVRRDHTKDEDEVAVQVVSESLPHHQGLEPPSGDVEQNGDTHDGVDTKHHDTHLSNYNPLDDENLLKERYTQAKFSLSTFAAPEPESLSLTPGL